MNTNSNNNLQAKRLAGKKGAQIKRLKAAVYLRSATGESYKPGCPARFLLKEAGPNFLKTA